MEIKHDNELSAIELKAYKKAQAIGEHYGECLIQELQDYATSEPYMHNLSQSQVLSYFLKGLVQVFGGFFLYIQHIISLLSDSDGTMRDMFEDYVAGMRLILDIDAPKPLPDGIKKIKPL